jgi:hypothetical protein
VPDRIQILAIGVSAAFLILVLELVRRRKLVEEYSFLWIVVAVLVLAVSIWRELLHTAARDLGVHDPPNVLLIALTAAVLFALLGVSLILSRQRRQIDRLIEDTSILSAEVKDLRSRGENATYAPGSGPNRPAE